jgi:hypothetical protein
MLMHEVGSKKSSTKDYGGSGECDKDISLGFCASTLFHQRILIFTCLRTE